MALRLQSQRAAISRTAITVVVIVIIVVGLGGAYYLTTRPSPSTTSTSTSTTSSSSTTPQTLVMDDTTWPINGVNVLTFVDEVPWPDWFQDSVYQPLVTANTTAEYQDGVIQYLPVLATGWTISNDNTTYTFNLRQGVKFSNGDPFNAYQVWSEFYIFYYLSGNSSGFWQSYNVFNTSSINFGPSTLAMMNSTDDQMTNPSPALMSIMTNTAWPIYVTGPYTIVFHLQAPFLYFLGTLISYVGMTFDTQYVLNHGGAGTPVAFNPTFDTTPIPGTGPYTITTVSTNDYIQFTQNPTYWGDNLTAAQIAANPVLDPGHVKNVVVNYLSDDLSRLTALETGAAQLVAIDSAADWPTVLSGVSTGTYQYLTLPPWSADISALSLNVNLYPTNITAVRQAIVHAINYSDINQTVFFGKMTAGVMPEYPLYSQYYNLGNFAPYQYNVSEAKDILSAAGINPAKLPTIEFRTVSSCAFCISIATIVVSDLQAIGFNANITTLTDAAYSATYGNYATNVANANENGQISILGGETWSPSALTPADAWVSFISNDSSWGNWAGFSTPAVQACVNAFTSSSNATAIQDLCAKAQAQIYTDAPYATLGYANLWYYSGSLVWKTGVIKSFALDPCWSGIDTMPLINTVQFG